MDPMDHVTATTPGKNPFVVDSEGGYTLKTMLDDQLE